MNEQVDMTKVMDKIRKLMALAGSSNEHEAASAAEKAQALLAEYNLSMTDIRSAGAGKEDDVIIDDSMVTDSLPWRRSLGTMVARLYFCDYLFHHRKEYVPTRPNGYIRYDHHSFVGKPHNIEVAKVMFKYLTETVEELANKKSLDYPVNERSKYRTSFKAACANRLCHRINDRIEAAKRGEVKTASGTNLPALASLYDQAQLQAKNFMEQRFGKKLREKSVRLTTSHYGGVRDGYEAGNKIGLDQQVGSDKTRRIGSG